MMVCMLDFFWEGNSKISIGQTDISAPSPLKPFYLTVGKKTFGDYASRTGFFIGQDLNQSQDQTSLDECLLTQQKCLQGQKQLATISSRRPFSNMGGRRSDCCQPRRKFKQLTCLVSPFEFITHFFAESYNVRRMATKSFRVVYCCTLYDYFAEPSNK